MRLRVCGSAEPDPIESMVFTGIVEEASALGTDVEVVDDIDPDDEGDEVYLVVPERFFAQTACRTSDLQERANRTIGLVLAPQSSSSLDEASQQAQRCRTAFATSRAVRDILLARGVDARYFPSRYTPSWDAWTGSTDSRQESFYFTSTLSSRSGKLLSGLGESMWDQRWTARFTPDLSSRARRIHCCEGLELARVLAHSQFFLDLSDDKDEPADGLIMALAAINGAVVLTERTNLEDWMRPGENCLLMPGERAVEVLPGLARDEEILNQLRRVARESIEDKGLSESVSELLAVAREALDATVVLEVPNVPAHEPEAAEIPGGWPTRLGSEELIAASLRRLEGRVLALSRDMQRLQLGLSKDAPSPTSRLETPAWSAPAVAPRVSVIVSLHNYGDVVNEALESVCRSVGISYELVVQDDGSTDESFRVLSDFISRHPQIPILGIHHELNQGLSATRNDLLNESRGEYVFSLDADNGVFPTCLSRLAEALDGDPEAAFAYALIADRELGDYTSLSSVLGWDPEYLRKGNYIDAMAMLRVSAIREVGGWDTAMLFGWEDFQLWARFAETGRHAVFVPQVLSWYRKTNTSMLMGARLDEMSLWAQVRSAAPRLMADDSVGRAEP